METSSDTVHSRGFHIPAFGYTEHVGVDCGLRRVESGPLFCTSQSEVMTDFKKVQISLFPAELTMYQC